MDLVSTAEMKASVISGAKISTKTATVTRKRGSVALCLLTGMAVTAVAEAFVESFFFFSACAEISFGRAVYGVRRKNVAVN